MVRLLQQCEKICVVDGLPLALPYAGQTFAQRKRADARFAMAETKQQMAKAVHRACLVGKGKAKKAVPTVRGEGQPHY
jgi:hypothetical protein